MKDFSVFLYLQHIESIPFMNVIAVPLTHIINASIVAGEVPAHWKEAIVVPILKL